METMIRLTTLKIGKTEKLQIVLRCPACHHLATLDELENVSDYATSSDQARLTIFGHRVCPNPSCQLLLYVAYTISPNSLQGSNPLLANIILVIPQERIDFDATDIPIPIVNSLEEAITCNANGCYIAGAIMIRKTLEELCRDKGASGKRLVDQINDLSNHVIVPKDLLARVYRVTATKTGNVCVNQQLRLGGSMT